MLHTIKKGFTLIELLVVITIIGILATGAVTTFTSQIQKARDTTRISDMKALQGAIEQAYQDYGQYPGKWGLKSTTDGILAYMPRFPQDPKSGQASTSAFDYLYNASSDANTINRQEYEVSVTFEQSGNITTKAATDGWDDPLRLESGINVNDPQQLTVRANSINSTATTDQCVGNTWSASASCTASRSTLIRKN